MSEERAPPEPDEVEVSLFGPGFGECVLLHLGAGDWLLVDSCVDQQSRQQPALRYLRGLGYDPAEAVKIVVATHWHDDHVRGLAAVVRTCQRAAFCCSLALAEREALVFFGGQEPHTYRAGAREFHDALAVLDERTPPGVINAITPVNWAITEKRLFHRPARDGRPEAEVVALSPSDAAVTRAQQALRALMPALGDPPRDAGWSSPNHNAVVLWVRIGSVVVLLGADLEETGHPQLGWTAIVDSFSRAPAGAFKVPHHGSRNGHHPRVWTDMLVAEPFTALTPFERGDVVLPTPADRQRICDLTPQAFITAPRARFRPARLDPVVDQTMDEATSEHVELDRRTGHVRLRRTGAGSAAGSWAVGLFNGAERLRPPAPARRKRRRRRTRPRPPPGAAPRDA